MRTVRAVMSIQSTVVYGHVGSTAAALPLHRLGFDVWALPTVVYSSHAGYPGVRGRRTPVSELRELLAGLEALGRLDCCEAVLSGYLGSPATWSVVLEALAAVRRSAPAPGTSAIPCSETRASCTSRPSSCARSARRPSRAPISSSPTASSWSGSSTGRCAPWPRRSPPRPSCTRPGREKWSSRGSCSTTRDARPSTSSGSMTTARGLRAPRTSPQFWSGSGDVFTALVAGLRLAGTPLDETVARGTALMEELIARTFELGSPELRMVEIDWASQPAGAHAVRVA